MWESDRVAAFPLINGQHAAHNYGSAPPCERLPNANRSSFANADSQLASAPKRPIVFMLGGRPRNSASVGDEDFRVSGLSDVRNGWKADIRK